MDLRQESAASFTAICIAVADKLKAASQRMSLAQLHAGFDRAYSPDQLRAALENLARNQKIDAIKDGKNVSLHGIAGQAYAPQAGWPRVASAVISTPIVSPAKPQAQPIAAPPRTSPEISMTTAALAGRGETRARVQKLLEADPDISNGAIAKKLGVTEGTISYHRTQIAARGAGAPLATERKTPAVNKTLPAVVTMPQAPDAAQFAFWNTGELQIEARGGLVRLNAADRAALGAFLKQLPAG
jgi:hypothetical protein